MHRQFQKQHPYTWLHTFLMATSDKRSRQLSTMLTKGFLGSSPDPIWFNSSWKHAFRRKHPGYRLEDGGNLGISQKENRGIPYALDHWCQRANRIISQDALINRFMGEVPRDARNTVLLEAPNDKKAATLAKGSELTAVYHSYPQHVYSRKIKLNVRFHAMSVGDEHRDYKSSVADLPTPN